VFAGSNGQAPPLSLRENYALLQRQMNESLRQGNAPTTTGQAGMRVAEVAAKLVREIPARLASQSVPRVIASTSSPLESTFLQRLVTDAIDEASVPPHLNDPQNVTIARMRQALRVSTRRHEESMLRPPARNEPACAMGGECRGNSIICQGGGMTLMAFYYENEWAKYRYDVEHGVPNARLPDNARMCLLCLRYDTNRFLMSTRTQNVQFLVSPPATTDASGGANDTSPLPALVQPHFNLTNVEGEYRLEDCNTPVAPVFEGMLYPMVKPSLIQFARAVDPETGGVIFRQLFPYPNARTSTTMPTSSSSF